MIEHKTIIDQPELSLSGVLGVRIAFVLIEDGIELDRKWHRTSIPIDVDPNMQMAAVNAHLATMRPPMPALAQSDIAFIAKCHSLLKQHKLGNNI